VSPRGGGGDPLEGLLSSPSRAPLGIDPIHWQRHDFIDTGCQPAVAVNNTGWMISVCKSDYFPMLYYRIGYLVEEEAHATHLSDSDPRDSRDSKDDPSQPPPEAAAGSSPPRTSLRSLFSPLKKQFSLQSNRHSSSAAAARFTWAPTCAYSCQWFESFRYDFGCCPAVALSNRGWVVAMHKSEIGNSLYYRVGRLDKFSKTIEWRNETKLEGHVGINPSPRFPDMDGLFVELSYVLVPSERRAISSSSFWDEDDAPSSGSPAAGPDRRILTAQIVERSGDWGIELLEGHGQPRLLSEATSAYSFKNCALLPDQQTGIHLFQGRSLLSESPVLYCSLTKGDATGPPLKVRFRQLFFVEAQIQDEILFRYDASPEADVDGKIEFVAAALRPQDYPSDARRFVLHAPKLLAAAAARGKITRAFPFGPSPPPPSFPPVNITSTTHPSAPWFSSLPEIQISESHPPSKPVEASTE
ncbi:MAG: hypothetical protein Q8P67_05935, partial [archaeon]|nr:hypothetical protein [archaeon]